MVKFMIVNTLWSRKKINLEQPGFEKNICINLLTHTLVVEAAKHT